jgi:hypothetical protein
MCLKSAKWILKKRRNSGEEMGFLYRLRGVEE